MKLKTRTKERTFLKLAGITATMALMITQTKTHGQTWKQTAFENIREGVEFVIADTTTATAMSNDNGAAGPPTAITLTFNDDKSALDTTSITESILWKLERIEGGVIIHPAADSTKWLYCNNSNNGVRVGTGNNKIFVIYGGNWLQCTGNNRYIGVYNSTEWRCYTTAPENSVIKNTRTIFYQKAPPCPTAEGEITITGCDSVIYDNNHGFREVFYEDYSIMETLPMAARPECDSTLIVHIRINHSKFDTTSIIGNDSLIWRGNTYYNDTTIIEKQLTAAGCDSVNTFYITIIPTIADDTVPIEDTLPPPLLSHHADTSIIIPYGKNHISRHNLPDTAPKINSQWLQFIDTCTNNAPELLYPDSTYNILWKIRFTNGERDSIMQSVTILKPPCGNGFYAADADGNLYKTVRLGYDCWMAENLSSRHYGNSVAEIGGELIPTALAYYVDLYPDTAANVATYGRLYDWYSAVGLVSKMKDSVLRKNEHGHIQGVCPDGWFLPCDTDLQVLLNYDIKGLKSVSGWLTGNGTNALGFNVKPAGYYDFAGKEFYNMLGNAYFWSCSEISKSEAINNAFKYSCDTSQINITDKANGYSIRCLKE